MRLFNKSAKGITFQIIGVIIILTSWIIPTIFVGKLSTDGHAEVMVLLGQMVIGLFLFLFGWAVQKREDEDPNYKIPINILKVFKAWQILLMIAVISFYVLVIGDFDKEHDQIRSILKFAMLIFSIAAIVVGIVQHQNDNKNYIKVGREKMIRTKRKEPIWCNGCQKILNPQDYFTHEGKKYCCSCYMILTEQEQIKNKENRIAKQIRCSVCKRLFPKSSFHLVNNELMCDECFKKEYSVDL